MNRTVILMAFARPNVAGDYELIIETTEARKVTYDARETLLDRWVRHLVAGENIPYEVSSPVVVLARIQGLYRVSDRLLERRERAFAAERCREGRPVKDLGVDCQPFLIVRWCRVHDERPKRCWIIREGLANAEAT